jgi:hypothetical protein
MVGECPEMEFSYINFTKDSSLLLQIHCNLLLADLTANHTLLWFKTRTKKSAKEENSSFMNSMLRTGKTRVENQAKLESEKTRGLWRN